MSKTTLQEVSHIFLEWKNKLSSLAYFYPLSMIWSGGWNCIFEFGQNLLGSPTLPSSSVITNVGLPDQTKFILISRPAWGWYSHDKAVFIICDFIRWKSVPLIPLSLRGLQHVACRFISNTPIQLITNIQPFHAYPVYYSHPVIFYIAGKVF